MVNGDNQNALKILGEFKGHKISCGLKRQVDFKAEKIRINERGQTEFELKSTNKNYNGQEFNLKILGEFNVYNALVVIGVAAILGIKAEVIRKVLGNFNGVWRRFEFKGKKEGIEYYDDYAHHPTEIRATLEAAEQKLAGKKLWLIYQPHLYSRTKDFMDEFATALNLADNLLHLKNIM